MVQLFITIFLICISSAFSQQSPNQTWYFGKFGGLRFNNAVPTPITGKLDTWEGSAVYSDPASGNPLLYSDGKKLYQADGSVVPGGRRGGRQAYLQYPDRYRVCEAEIRR